MLGPDQAADRRVELLFNALNIQASNGAPARVVARRVRTK
jgi:hypothetical protein